MPNLYQLPFSEAIDYFAEKTNLDTSSWIEGQGIVQQAAFTVAGAKGALLQDIREATATAINDGISIAKFAKEFDKIADRYSANWQLKGDRAWRAQLIYEQNLRQANAAGRYAQMTDPETIKRRPYWQWRHGDSRAPRPAHLALDNKVFRADSLPFFPPSGFSCKCQVFSLSQRDIDREKLTVENLLQGQDIDYIDPSSGATRTAKLEPDPGFAWKPDRNLTPARRAEILKNLAPDLRQQVEREYLAAIGEPNFTPASPQDIRQIEDWAAEYRAKNTLTRREQEAFGTAQQIQQQDVEDFRGITSNGILQAAATVFSESDHVYLDFIASAPWNVSEDRSNRIPGSATALLKLIAEESIARGFEGRIHLTSIPGAVLFYEQQGFEYDEVEREYKLSPAAAQALLNRKSTPQFMKDSLDEEYCTAAPAWWQYENGLITKDEYDTLVKANPKHGQKRGKRAEVAQR